MAGNIIPFGDVIGIHRNTAITARQREICRFAAEISLFFITVSKTSPLSESVILTGSVAGRMSDFGIVLEVNSDDFEWPSYSDYATQV